MSDLEKVCVTVSSCQKGLDLTSAIVTGQKRFLFFFLDSLAAPVNVSIRDLKGSSAVLTWDTPDGETVIGFAITQQVITTCDRERKGHILYMHAH